MIRHVKWLWLITFAALLAPLSARANIASGGGPVMTGRVNVYVIYYGNIPLGASSENLINTFISNYGKSHLYGILVNYTSPGGRVSQNLALAGTTSDPGSQGTSIYDSGVPGNDVPSVVKHSITPNGPFPEDQNGIYIVYQGSNISILSYNNDNNGTCNNGQTCGAHNSFQQSDGALIKYAYVGAGDCDVYPMCAGQSQTFPNNNPWADSNINVTAHEIAEAVTDPYPFLAPAWGGQGTNTPEVGDPCAWDFDEHYAAPNGIQATEEIDGNYYEIQKLWTPTSGGACYSGYSPLAGILFQQPNGGAVSAWKMQGLNSYQTLKFSSIPAGQYILAVGDFDNGVDSEILTQDVSNASGPVSVYALHGDGTTTSRTLLSSWNPDLYIQAVGDLNGDGYDDLVIGSQSTGDYYIWVMFGGNVIEEIDLQVAGAGIFPWSIADFNGDGLNDLLWVNVDGYQYNIWLNTSAGTLNGAPVTNIQFAYQSIVNDSVSNLQNVGDYNGQGRAEVGYRPGPSGATTVDFLSFSNGVTSKSPYLVNGSINNPAPDFLNAGDINRDGAMDFIGYVSNKLTVYQTATWKNGRFSGVYVQSTGNQLSLSAVGGEWNALGYIKFKESAPNY